MSDGFLSRWSRRKRAVEQAERPAPQPLAATDPSEAVAVPEPDQTPELAPDEIAALPSLEDLTPETDLTGFLRQGVPASLRNAALRRMWSLDPAVRDYVGDARDYAWDWNAPGGVPGFGPLAPTDDVYATLDEMFTRPRTAEADPATAGRDAAEPEREAESETDALPDPGAPASEPAALPAPEDAPPQRLAPEEPDEADAGAEPVGVRPSPTAEPVPAATRRRHGGATPH
jgi:uncharacterized protein DUF3306